MTNTTRGVLLLLAAMFSLATMFLVAMLAHDLRDGTIQVRCR